MSSKYLQELCGTNEKIIYEAETHPLAIIMPIAWCSIGVGFIFGKHKAIIDFFTTVLAVSNQRIIGKRGWLSIDTMELRLERVSTVQIQQPLLGRILGYGNIRIASDGYHNHTYRAIKDPINFKKIVNDAVENKIS